MKPIVTKTIPADHPRCRNLRKKHPGLVRVRYYRHGSKTFKTIEIREDGGTSRLKESK